MQNQITVRNTFASNDIQQRTDIFNEKLKEIIKRGEKEKKVETKAGN